MLTFSWYCMSHTLLKERSLFLFVEGAWCTASDIMNIDWRCSFTNCRLCIWLCLSMKFLHGRHAQAVGAAQCSMSKIIMSFAVRYHTCCKDRKKQTEIYLLDAETANAMHQTGKYLIPRIDLFPRLLPYTTVQTREWKSILRDSFNRSSYAVLGMA